MVQQVKAEDGTLHEFPDEATPDQMMAAISTSKPAAPAEKPGIMSRIKEGVLGVPATALGDIETGYRMAQGAVQAIPAGLAGIAQGAYNVGAEALGGKPGMPAGERVEQVQSYGAQPLTQVAKQNMQTIGRFVQPMVEAARAPGTRLAEAGYPTLGTIVGSAPEAAMTMLAPESRSAMGSVFRGAEIGGAVARVPAVARTAERIASAGEAKAAGLNEAAAAKNELISEAKRLKFKLTPQQADSGIVGKVAASVASRPQLEREFSLHNAESARAAAAADVGITGQLTATSVAKKIQETLPAYLTPRTFGKMNLAEDSVWQSKLEEIRGISKQAEIDFPDDVAPAIQEEIKKFDRRIVDANSVVEKVASLRERSSDNFAANNSGARALARVQRKLADELENALERHGEKIGQKGAVQTFRNARRQLAKLYTIRDSMTPAGDIDLGELAKRYHGDEKLDGNLLTMAKLKVEFDRSFQPPLSVRSHVVGSGDVVLGAGAFAATGQIGPAAIVAARPATRMVLGSPLYQKYAIGPKIAKPSLAARAARKITEAGKKGQTLKSLPPSETEAAQ